MKKKIFEVLYDNFNVGDVVSKDEIRSFLLKFYDNLSDASLGWRIYDLKSNGYMIAKNKGTYIILDKNKYNDFIVDIDQKLLNRIKEYNMNMYNIKKLYPNERNINVCIWNTKLLNKYTTHQTFKNYYIVEIDKERIENLFYALKADLNDVFLLKKTLHIEYLLNDNSIIIDNLPLKSPLDNKRSFKEYFVSTPKVEKILVDVFVYNKKILPYDESEIMNIYKNIYKKHIVKTKTVLHYARLRGQNIKKMVKDMLLEIGEVLE